MSAGEKISRYCYSYSGSDSYMWFLCKLQFIEQSSSTLKFMVIIISKLVFASELLVNKIKFTEVIKRK